MSRTLAGTLATALEGQPDTCTCVRVLALLGMGEGAKRPWIEVLFLPEFEAIGCLVPRELVT